MKDTIEVTSVVDGNPNRMQFKPLTLICLRGLNIRLVDLPVDQEAVFCVIKSVRPRRSPAKTELTSGVWAKLVPKSGSSPQEKLARCAARSIGSGR